MCRSSPSSSASATGSTAWPGPIRTRRRFADALFGPVPAGRALVAVLDGAVAGLAAYSFLWPAAGVTRSLYLKELFVRAAARRHGIGGLLMRELRAVAAEHRCSRVEWTADTDQPEAQRFYAALGAEVLATKLFYRV